MAHKDFTFQSYRELLSSAIKGGYQFVGFDSHDNTLEKACLLRHDIDIELLDCLQMARIENELGIRSTYFLMVRSSAYNLFCAESISVVKELLLLNHFIGLHFMGELVEAQSVPNIVKLVSKEIARMEEEFGVDVKAVSFHQPTDKILSSNMEIPGKINTYNKFQLSEYRYVSDSNMRWKQEHPQEIFERGASKRLQLLIHPIWWTERAMTPIEKWKNAISINHQVVLKHLLDREVTLQECGMAELQL